MLRVCGCVEGKELSGLPAHFCHELVWFVGVDQICKYITPQKDSVDTLTGYRLYAFNQLISDRIGNHRDIPDTRHRLYVF